MFLTAGAAEIKPYKMNDLSATVYYNAVQPLEQGSDCKTAIVFIHGWHGGLTVHNAQKMLVETLGGDAYVVAPLFPTPMRMKENNVKEDGRAIWNNSWNRPLTQRGLGEDDWRGGGDACGTRISSFDVVDRIFSILGNRKLYPKLKKVMLVGFSAGGQFTGRYVAVGKGKVRSGVKLTYLAVSPSSLLRLDNEAAWHYGLANRPRYSRDLTFKQILKNLSSRDICHACGTNDVGPESLDKSDFAMAQGKNRYDRFLNFQEYVKQYPGWARKCVFHSIEGIKHESVKAYSDPFILNWIKK